MVGIKLKDLFAALVPLSSAFSSESLGFDEINIKVENNDFEDMPVWSFIHKRDADGNSSNSKKHGCRVIFQSFEDKDYNPVFTHWFEETNHNMSANDIKNDIEKGKIHFYTEYNYTCNEDCHFAMTKALKEPLLFDWLFRQKK